MAEKPKNTYEKLKSESNEHAPKPQTKQSVTNADCDKLDGKEKEIISANWADIFVMQHLS